MWVKRIIKLYPVKKIDMSLRRTFGVEGVCTIYTTRDASKLAYLIITRDETGEILISNDDHYIEQQFQENLFNVEVVIKEVISRIALRECLLKQIEGILTKVKLPISVDVRTRTLFHVTPTSSIEQFHIDPRQNNVLDLRYLGELSGEKYQAVEILRKIGITVWVKEKTGMLFLEEKE